MHPHDKISIRIYGQTITLWRMQWGEMLDDMLPDCENARRIREHLAT